jgi:hypothetical protein
MEEIVFDTDRSTGRRGASDDAFRRPRARVGVIGGMSSIERIILGLLIGSLLLAVAGTARPLYGGKPNRGKLGPVLSRLAVEHDSRGAAGVREFAAVHGLRTKPTAGGELVPVVLEPLARGDAAGIDTRAVIEAGGIVDAVSRSYMRILVPAGNLTAIGRLESIRRARVPIPATPVDVGYGPIIAESVGLTGAAAAQLAGLSGAGVKVAVVDLGFIGLDGAIAAGEIPAGAHRVQGNVEDVIIDGYTVHGVGVAEHVMDMAPGVELYCILVTDEVDLENAALYIRDNGIRIANHSVAWVNASYYDDTGPIAAIINGSHDTDGVFWAVASGNQAGRHWRGGWNDPDGNGILDFFDTVEDMVISGTQSTASVFLNWDQYGASVTDLDLYVYDKDENLIAASTGSQTGSEDPAEGLSFTYSPAEIPYSIQVHHFSGPTDGLDITIFSFRHNVQFAVPEASIMEPADAHGAFTVGAVYQGDWNDPDPPLESFSSRGPTTDGRPKPDIAGPDGTRSWTYGPSFGTSFASPNTAGAAALLPELYPAITADEMEDTLRAWAVDAGAPGADNEYGAGLLNLPFSIDGGPAILSIIDVPDDQGLQLEVIWARSGLEFAGSPVPVSAYDIYRRNGSNGWDSIATIAAAGTDEYMTNVPTENDSTAAGGIYYTPLFVRARTEPPVSFFDSAPDSGYSVDNLIPPAPTGLAVGYNEPGGNHVRWDRSPEPDIDHYNVYRGESDGFIPDPASLVHQTPDTFWVDPVPEGYRYAYKVTAIDDAGNEGAPASPGLTTGTDECCFVPSRYALHQNFPNPFNPVTMIKFDVRERARARLAVYNVNGQRVRMLLDGEVQPGSREVIWNGTDDAGRRVASGIYFYRLEVPGYVQSRKMILLR